ncbi:MAG: YbhB/YbcL family Raf kinase inhibitor-like protein [Gemmatimonadota bacterium]|nr:YbhB/YbcL family Raf kinase inhibitor-like protein [Gemmatimonadota bacterium]
MLSLSRTYFAVAALLLCTASASGQAAKAQKAKPKAAVAGHFKLTAPDLSSKGRIALTHVFNGMGCDGQNISPALVWTNAPAGTKSFAVTIYDPDAPTGSGWWHWVMYNIPASATGLAAGAGNGRNAPSGSAQGATDFGTKGYGGPCPPVGDKPHHYHITVFALKTEKLDVPGSATAAYVGFNLNANKLATARVTGLYGR